MVGPWCLYTHAHMRIAYLRYLSQLKKFGNIHIKERLHLNLIAVQWFQVK